MLTRLRLEHFKSFDQEEVRLAPMTVLVGANAAGKSNLLDALQFLQGAARGLSIVDVLGGRWESGRKVWPGVRGGPTEVVQKGASGFEIESEWRVAHETITHRIGVTGGEHPMLARESLHSDQLEPYLFDTHAGAIRDQTGPSGGSIRVALKRSGKGNSPTQQHSAGRSLLHQIETEKPVAPQVRRARDAVVDGLRRAYFLDITPARMRDYVPRQIDNLGLEGENVSAVTWQICQDPRAKADLVDWLTELCAPELADIEFVEPLGDVMLVLVEKGGRRIPARSLSDGTLRFLGELVALRTAEKGALLLIEEIENGLHPTRAHLLVEAMESAVRERGIQILATTHSPLVLNALSPETLRDAVLVARPPDRASTILRRLGDLPEFDAVVGRRGIDRLLASGWLERAV